MGIVDTAKDAVHKAQDAAVHAVTVAKDKGHELTLKRRQDALAQELGHIVFRQREGEAALDAEIDRLVGEMRALKAEIDGMEE